MSNEHNHEAKAAPAVPQGWKLVPIEPTLGMLRSGHNSISCVGSCGEASPPEVSDFSDVWTAMLSATPAAPSQPVTLTDELDKLDVKVSAGLCQVTADGKHAYLREIQVIIAALREKWAK